MSSAAHEIPGRKLAFSQAPPKFAIVAVFCCVPNKTVSPTLLSTFRPKHPEAISAPRFTPISTHGPLSATDRMAVL